MSEGVMARYEQVGKLSQLERPAEIARAAGGMTGLTDPNSKEFIMGAKYGMRPQEVATSLASVARSIGIGGGMTKAGLTGDGSKTIFSAMAAGVSPEMMARFYSLGGRGGGATQNLSKMTEQGIMGGLMRTLRQGGVSNLSGAKIDEALARISAATTQMAEQGMFLDLNMNNRMTNALMQAGDAKRGESLGGINVFGGMHGVRSALRLNQSGARAAADFRGQFSQLGTVALQAAAFQNASGPLDALRNMEQTAQSSGAVREAILGILGNGVAGQLGLAGQGFSADQARILAGEGFEIADAFGRKQGWGAGGKTGGFKLSKLMAEHERKEMAAEAALAGADASAEMLKAMHGIRLTLINVGQKATSYLATVNSILAAVAGGSPAAFGPVPAPPAGHTPAPPAPPAPGGGAAGGSSGGGGGARSDMRFKNNIEELDESRFGRLGLKEYMWDWNEIAAEMDGLSGEGRGVIAQLVVSVMPEAVFEDKHGYLFVDYDMLLEACS